MLCLIVQLLPNPLESGHQEIPATKKIPTIEIITWVQ